MEQACFATKQACFALEKAYFVAAHAYGGVNHGVFADGYFGQTGVEMKEIMR
jgi:hypothetical protein